MYWRQILKGMHSYRRDLRILARKCNNKSLDSQNSELYRAYLEGARDAYKDSVSRMSVLIDGFEVW